MNNSKRINVNFSSLVGLKAELLKKQAEVKGAKLQAENTQFTPKVKLKKPSKNEEHDKTIKDVIEEPDEKLSTSKLMLEAKSKLYAQLKKTKTNNDSYLVDFTLKSDDESEEEDRIDNYEEDETALDPEERWIEYRDCFGRTRKCLKKDLPYMREKDDRVKHQIMKDEYDEQTDHRSAIENFVVQEKEPGIEAMRKKWEEQEKKLSQKSDVHYQDILFDEARTHGVGFYAFSQDEQTRIKQQQELFKLRKDTEQKQKEAKDIREVKDKLEKNRLRVANIRRRIRAGLPAEPEEVQEPTESETVDSSSNNQEPTIQDNQPNEIKEPEKIDTSLMRIQDKVKAFGELLGKRPEWREMSQEEWVHKCREQRNKEFAPNYDDTKSRKRSWSSDEDEIFPPEKQNSTTKKENSQSTGPDPVAHSSIQDSPNTNQSQMNEESILVGLRYLRKKFETEKNV